MDRSMKFHWLIKSRKDNTLHTHRFLEILIVLDSVLKWSLTTKPLSRKSLWLASFFGYLLEICRRKCLFPFLLSLSSDKQHSEP